MGFRLKSQSIAADKNLPQTHADISINKTPAVLNRFPLASDPSFENILHTEEDRNSLLFVCSITIIIIII